MYIGSGLGVCCLLLIIVGVVIGLIIAARKRSTSRRQFRYAPIAPDASHAPHLMSSMYNVHACTNARTHHNLIQKSKLLSASVCHS